MRERGDVWCEPWAVKSSAVAALGPLVLQQAAAVDAVAARMTAVAYLDWESPAGRNYREYVLVQTGGLRRASELLRDAASWIESVADRLRSVEYDDFLARLQ